MHPRRGRPKGPPKRNPRIDDLILGGLSLKKMKNALGEKGIELTVPGIRDYMIRTGQHKGWKEERREDVKSKLKSLRLKYIKKRRKFYEELAGLLIGGVYRLTEEEKYKKKAFEYYFNREKNRPPTDIPLENLVKLLEVYQEVEESGEKISLSELSERSGIRSASSAGRVLKKVGLKPFYGTKETMPREKEEAILRAFYSDMSASETAYFLGVKENAVVRIFSKTGKRKVTSIIKRTGRGSKNILNSIKASQIYEALDLGFDLEETTELVDLNPELVSYAINERRDMEQDIIRKLRLLLYPKEDIKKPYL